MRAGDTLPTWAHTVTAAPMQALAKVLRDPNLIHLDPSAAAAAGLGNRVINQGPANLAYLIDLLGRTFPESRLLSLESRYLANVRDGDTVEAGGVITASDDEAIRCDLWLNVRGSGPAVTASATLVRRL